MRAQELIKYINNPELLDKESIPLLQKLTTDFPYFQSAHILLSIAAQKWDSSVYQQSIKKTAIVVTNRSHLYNLIHKTESPIEEIINSTETTKINKTKEPKEELKTAQYVRSIDENIVEKEIEKALVTSIVEKEIAKVSKDVTNENTAQPVNFTEWLQFLKKNKIQDILESENNKSLKNNKSGEPGLRKTEQQQFLRTKQKQKELIDKIIDINPGLIRQKEEQRFFKSDFKAKESLLENEHLVTETLAQIYAEQGNINKAIRAYEILSLKFPQKSVYFASLIQKLKNNQ